MAGNQQVTVEVGKTKKVTVDGWSTYASAVVAQDGYASASVVSDGINITGVKEGVTEVLVADKVEEEGKREVTIDITVTAAAAVPPAEEKEESRPSESGPTVSEEQAGGEGPKEETEEEESPVDPKEEEEEEVIERIDDAAVTTLVDALPSDETIKANLKEISKKGDLNYASLCNILVDFSNKLSPKVAVGLSPEKIVATEYSMYYVIKDILEETVTANPTMFANMFNILNKTLVALKDDGLDYKFLTRYLEEWSWGDKELESYDAFISLVTLLADPATRTTNKASITIVDELNKTTFSQDLKDAIIAYYN